MAMIYTKLPHLSSARQSAITRAMLSRLIPDRFILLLLGVIALASFLPAQGSALSTVSTVSNIAIFSLFFFHGLRLSREAVWAGIKHWRLQLAIVAFTYAALPLAGLSLSLLMPALLSPGLWIGVLFLCALPSTVQAAISSSSMAGGNVAASVVAAALSNIAGVILTPLIVAGIASVSGTDVGLGSIGKIAGLLLLPFILGQIAHGWFGAWAERHKLWIGRMDRLTIILAVYVAFSAAVVDGLWQRLTLSEFGPLLLIVCGLLAFAFAATWWIGGALSFAREDRITLLYSGSHKTLATGAPMARILFPGAEAGLIIIPLMLYHQLQLIISPWTATRLTRST
jgi:solute carrier family 10 (sodium/bile acid cotransporter), member 7